MLAYFTERQHGIGSSHSVKTHLCACLYRQKHACQSRTNERTAKIRASKRIVSEAVSDERFTAVNEKSEKTTHSNI